MTIPSLTFFWQNQSSLLIQLPAKIEESQLRILLHLTKHIEQDVQLVQETQVIYHTALVVFKKEITDSLAIENTIKNIYKKIPESNSINKPKTWKIPVCYDLKFGIDTMQICTSKNIDTKELIELHTQPTYTVYGIGFLPGFLYLGGLDPILHYPRKNTPRISIPKGSVGIGGQQTGIYPQESPGGWQLIGKSPFPLFEPYKTKICPIQTGDKVQFYEIPYSTYKELNQNPEKLVIC